MAFKLHEFHGGMHLEEHKAEALAGGLRQAGLPERLVLPLKQHVGDANKALVKRGDRVLRGQLIADNSSPFSAPIHAPTSGLIDAVDEFPVPHPSGQPDTCIIIDVDGKDEAIETAHLSNAADLEPLELIQKIQQAGVVGLGGAVFPSSAKLSRGIANGIDVLIINGAECEPYICCDDMLMQTSADDLVRGIFYLQHILSPKQTLIGIEDNKPKAIKAVKAALRENHLVHTRVVSIPTIYPSGGEKQLIKILTGKEVPRGELAFDIGIFCQNVGTCVAITQALDNNQPLISRIVTLSGDGIRQPGNWEVLLGTPIRYLVEQAGGYASSDNTAQHLVMGGPMMGFSLASDEIPIVKATNNILVMQQQTIPQTPGYHDECIRCGQCAEVCPVKLLPQQLYWQARAKNYERSEEYHLFDCIECGCCAAVCPSNIPLVQYYRATKSEIRAAREAQFKADRARVRFEFRERRLALKKQQDEERKRLKREALKKKNPAVADKNAVDPVQAALERVKAKKQSQKMEPKNTSNLTPAQLKQIEEADARRRAARGQNQ